MRQRRPSKTLPKPECEAGYTRKQIEEIVGGRLSEFDSWMFGQTMTICEGRRYNHTTKEYEISEDGVSHGSVVYPWDLERFLAGLPVID